MSLHKVVRYTPTRVFRRSFYEMETACGRRIREKDNDGEPCRECARVEAAREKRREREAA